MSNTRFIGSTFDSGMRVPNYVNGRMLHAEDLHADQEATLARLTKLGQAAGAGIVSGLTVERVAGSNNTIQISAGVGVNPRGDVIQLEANPLTLSLVIEPEVSTVLGSAGLFQPCDIATPGDQAVIDEGAYLLTVIPISRREGTTPVSGAASRGNTVECAAKWVVEGLEFKAIRLVGFGDNGVDVADTSTASNTRRNRLAHWCLGRKALGIFPFAGYDGAYSGLDLLSADDRTPCDLPLAVFYWGGENGIQFIDQWAARRRVALLSLAPAWSGMLGEKRPAEGEARLIQFQTHLTSLIANRTPSSIAAADFFAYLPPCGFVPTMAPEGVLRYVSGRLLALLLTGGTSTNEFPFPEDFANEADNWQNTKDNMVDAIIDYLQEQDNQGIRMPTFWGDLLPNIVEVITCDEMDTLLRERITHDPIVLEQRPPLRIGYLEEYLLQYLGARLLDGVPFNGFFGTFDVLEWTYIWSRYLRGLNWWEELDGADDWLMRSLRRYLGISHDLLLENMQRDDLVYAMFCREAGERVVFEVPREEDDDTGNRPIPAPIDRFTGNISRLSGSSVSELNRPNISAGEVASHILRVAEPQTPLRGELTRHWRRAIRRRGRRR
jgi:hypothetical protein